MRTYNSILIVIMVAVLAVGAYADNDKAEIKEDLLTVSGKVKIYAPADRATVSFDLSGTGSSLEEAFASVHAKTDSIVTQLTEIGLDQTNLHTSFFRSGENEGGKAFLSSKRDYKVWQTASVTTDKLELLEQIVVILSRNNVEDISEVSFELTGVEEFKLKALCDATTKARQKAESMCDIVGVKLGKVKEITERNPGQMFFRGGRASEMTFNSVAVAGKLDIIDKHEGGFFGQEFELEAEVKVVYNIDNSRTQVEPAQLGEL